MFGGGRSRSLDELAKARAGIGEAPGWDFDAKGLQTAEDRIGKLFAHKHQSRLRIVLDPRFPIRLFFPPGFDLSHCERAGVDPGPGFSPLISKLTLLFSPHRALAGGDIALVPVS